MDNVDRSLQAGMTIDKSNREVSVMEKMLLDKICRSIEGLKLEGDLEIRVLSMNEERILFDIMGVEGFDHIEFKITQTGWGISL